MLQPTRRLDIRKSRRGLQVLLGNKFRYMCTLWYEFAAAATYTALLSFSPTPFLAFQL
jgi:hypothetical protein